MNAVVDVEDSQDLSKTIDVVNEAFEVQDGLAWQNHSPSIFTVVVLAEILAGEGLIRIRLDIV